MDLAQIRARPVVQGYDAMLGGDATPVITASSDGVDVFKVKVSYDMSGSNKIWEDRSLGVIKRRSQCRCDRWGIMNGRSGLFQCGLAGHIARSRRHTAMGRTKAADSSLSGDRRVRAELRRTERRASGARRRLVPHRGGWRRYRAAGRQGAPASGIRPALAQRCAVPRFGGDRRRRHLLRGPSAGFAVNLKWTSLRRRVRCR